jgi:hypothetical protein
VPPDDAALAHEAFDPLAVDRHTLGAQFDSHPRGDP